MSRLTALGVAVGLVVTVACGGGEAEQEAAAGEVPEAAPAAVSQEMAAQQEMELPEGVTTEMVAQGKEIYAAAGLCYACHGAAGEGVPGLGSDLTDDEWVHSDGSYEGIVGTITAGVDASAATTKTAMPAKGGSGITEEQVKAVAAYVWTLSK